REVHVRGVTAPQRGRAVDVDEPVHVAHAVPTAALVVAGHALVALAARLEHLDGDPVTDRDTPSRRGERTDRLDRADDLVPGHEREAGGQVTGELLVVRAAQAARLHA